MATVVVTKTSGDPIYFPTIYREMRTGDSVSFTRRISEIPLMTDIMAEEAAARVTVAVTLSADELASSLTQADQSVKATDLAPVAATTGPSAGGEMRFNVATGGSATVTLIAGSASNPKIRVLDAMFYCSTGGGGGSTAILRTQASGGTVIATFDTSVTGRLVDATMTATVAATPGAAVGLFLVRSVNTIVGEVVVRYRYET